MPSRATTKVMPHAGAGVPHAPRLASRAAGPSFFGSPVCFLAGGAVAYGGYVDEVVAFTSGSGASTSRYYVHSNHLWSPAAITDSTGAVVERQKYDAYGRVTITSAGSVIRSKSAVGFDRGFTGQIRDDETGLNYDRARMYSPTLGRFISRDPIRRSDWGPSAKDGYVNGWGLYAGYFAPNSVDPFGTQDCWSILPWANTSTVSGSAKNGFTVQFLPACRPPCCKSVRIEQWIDNGDGTGKHRDNKDMETTDDGIGIPPLPTDPADDFYHDAPNTGILSGNPGTSFFSLTACAICLRSDTGVEETISCIDFTFNGQTGDLGGLKKKGKLGGYPPNPKGPFPGPFTGCPTFPPLYPAPTPPPAKP
jgi:RHS repeat-associated protein